MANLGPVEISGAKVQKIAHVPLRLDKETGRPINDEVQVDVTIRISHAAYLHDSVRLGTAWARRADVQVRMDFVEQLDLMSAARKTAESNGHDKDAGKLSGVEPIGGRKKQQGEKAKA